jgi:hypothetical protein
MRRSLVTLLALALLTAAAATVFHAHDAGAQAPPTAPGAPVQRPHEGGPAGSTAPGAPGGPGRGGPMRPYVWNAAHADSQIAMMLEHIKGKEDMPAESVYENIKILNGMPAKRLPAIMVRGFSRSVGMGCGGCHVRDNFASDDRGPKRVARQMFAMTQDLNKKYLPEMKDLEDEMPVINCWTCHRGQHVPETDADHPHPGPNGEDAPKPESAH